MIETDRAKEVLRQRARQVVARTPLRRVGRLRFPGSAEYWERRYRTGGDSGVGSAGELAAFKAEYLNDLVRRYGINSVIEFGCGDGRQLARATYPSYVGLDVAPAAIERCVAMYRNDATKSFFLYSPPHFHDPQAALSADLAISLDVIYHLTERDVFDTYMRHLLGAARRLVALYTNVGPLPGVSRSQAHLADNDARGWIEGNAPEWELLEHVPNPLPFDGSGGSIADFLLYTHRDS